MSMKWSWLSVLLGILVLACDSEESTNVSAGAPGGNLGSGNAGTSNTSAGGSGSQSGTGGTSTQNQGGTANVNAGGTANVNAGCAAWPKAKLFPTIGPFFYGTNPGPCKMIVTSGTTSTSTTTFNYTYDASGQLTGQVTDDGSQVTTYQYEQGLLTHETSTNTTASTQTVTTYTYSGNTVTYSSASAGATVSGYVYTLDAQGYPITVTALQVTSTDASVATHHTYEYENCRLLRRVGYNAANEEVTGQAAAYTYDESGRVSHRTMANRDESYDYSCW
jgi:YD repeat-containing protein